MLLLIWGEFFLIIFPNLRASLFLCSEGLIFAKLSGYHSFVVFFFALFIYVGIIVAYGIVLFCLRFQADYANPSFYVPVVCGIFISELFAVASGFIWPKGKSLHNTREREVSEVGVFLLSFLTLGWLPLSHEVTAPLKEFCLSPSNPSILEEELRFHCQQPQDIDLSLTSCPQFA